MDPSSTQINSISSGTESTLSTTSRSVARSLYTGMTTESFILLHRSVVEERGNSKIQLLFPADQKTTVSSELRSLISASSERLTPRQQGANSFTLLRSAAAGVDWTPCLDGKQRRSRCNAAPEFGVWPAPEDLLQDAMRYLILSVLFLLASCFSQAQTVTSFDGIDDSEVPTPQNRQRSQRGRRH